MPKETFYRLPDEKRERIMAAAEREFLENSFEAASINRIIKEAAIPRGSFYQYFSDKDDMIRYSISELTKSMQQFLHEAIVRNKGEIFKSFEDMFSDIVEFVNSDLKLRAFHRSILADHVLNDRFCSKEGKETVLNLLFKELEPYKEKWWKERTKEEICLLLEMLLDISGRIILDTFMKKEQEINLEQMKRQYHWKLGVLKKGFE